jgi:hypothetical protein
MPQAVGRRLLPAEDRDRALVNQFAIPDGQLWQVSLSPSVYPLNATAPYSLMCRPWAGKWTRRRCGSTETASPHREETRKEAFKGNFCTALRWNNKISFSFLFLAYSFGYFTTTWSAKRCVTGLFPSSCTMKTLPSSAESRDSVNIPRIINKLVHFWK